MMAKLMKTLEKHYPLTQFLRMIIIAAAASEPEANERGSSLISRRLLYRGLQSLFLGCLENPNSEQGIVANSEQRIVPNSE